MNPLVRKTPFVFVALAVLAACGTSTPTLQKISTISSTTAPQSLAMITPAPGLPTLVPSSTTYVPASPSAPVVGTETLPPSTPAPAPSGSDLAAMAAGKAPSASYFASLSAAQTSAIAALGTTGAPRGVMGTIANFSSDGFTVNVASGDFSAAIAAGAAYTAETDAAGASEVVTHVSSQTIDLVPGGYGALRAGMPIIVTGSGPASDFTATAVIANHANDSASASNVRARAESSVARDATPSLRKSSVRHRDDGSVRQMTSFNLTRTVGFPGGTIPDPPFVTPAATFGCAAVTLSFFITFGLGEVANYPMQLQDISDPSTYLEGQTESLPVQLVDAPSSSARTYFVNSGIAANLGLSFDLSACNPGKPAKTQMYPASLVVIGQALEADSVDPLPATGATDSVLHKSCPFIPFATGLQGFIVNLPTPSFSACFDQELTGATIKGTATITNATLVSVPNPNGMTDTSWAYQSDLPDGDPNVTLIPDASPTDGSEQDNMMSLSGMNADLTAQAVPQLMFCYFLDLCVTLGNGAIKYQVPSAFETSENVPALGIEQPSPVTLMLMPSDGTIPITVTGKKAKRL